MHHQMPELMGKRESHPVSGLVGVQHYQRGQAGNRKRDAAYSCASHIRVRYKYACALDQHRQVADWPTRNFPVRTHQSGDLLGVAIIFYVKAGEIVHRCNAALSRPCLARRGQGSAGAGAMIHPLSYSHIARASAGLAWLIGAGNEVARYVADAAGRRRGI